MQFTIGEVIERPIDEVFGFLANVERVPEWVPAAVSRTKQTEGPVELGTRVSAVDRILGRRMEFTEEVVEFEPPRSMAMKLSGALNGEFRGRLNHVGGATTVTFDVHVEPSGIAQRLLDPVVSRVAKRMMRADLQRLKGRLERTGHAAT